MKKLIKKIVLVPICFFMLSACAKDSSPDFKAAVKANKDAKSPSDWDSSEENPKNKFKKYREDARTNPDLGKEVCEGLKKLTPHELSLFEEELNEKENFSLLKDCRDDLKKSLEVYWQEQKKTLQNSTLNFSFNPIIEKRDLSLGYRAKTGDVQNKELILTFDDGPSETYTPKFLDLLRLVKARAIFFQLGPKVTLHPEIVRQAALDGHAIGSHSMTHQCLAATTVCTKTNNGVTKTFDEAVAEIRGGHQAIYNVLGFVDPFFRFPYGESDPNLVAYLASKQVGQFHWSIESADWKIQTNQELLTSVLAQIDKFQRGIVLFHDTQRRTLEILPDFLRAIYDRGYNVVILQSTDENARYNSQLVTKTPPIP